MAEPKGIKDLSAPLVLGGAYENTKPIAGELSEQQVRVAVVDLTDIDPAQYAVASGGDAAWGVPDDEAPAVTPAP